jgi:MoaA/NifB/PqqE/SkfB family radical SAM enzyme
MFLLRYIWKFRPRMCGGNLILHSHLPPLNSRAYARFVDEHLRRRISGPSHAQIGVTNLCPHRCPYCYNIGRSGEPMDTPAILSAVASLADLGVVWLGLTGGEPLLNPDLVTIVGRAAEKCAVKLFTTGSGLSPELARDLRRAGLFSVSVSLDHWEAGTHDLGRGHPGAFQEALGAIETFRSAGLDIGVSSVLTGEMIRSGETERLLAFLESLGIHEAWLSETKPSGRESWVADADFGEPERRLLASMQDVYNRRSPMTVNYLGHFEGPEHFGCNAGTKMVYVDAFGEVSPCVFTPLSFGNLRNRPLRDIWGEMSPLFKSSSGCFCHANRRLFPRFDAGELPIPPEKSAELAREAVFSPGSRFQVLLNGPEEG